MISIIIPVYNSLPYLDRCFTSILSQSYIDWECLLCDDGSTDGSSEKCDEWSFKDSRFKVIHLQHNGPSSARNNGIFKSKGKYLAFVDSDDSISTSYLSDMIYEACNIDLVVSGMSIIKKNSQVNTLVPQRYNKFYLTHDNCDSFEEYFNLPSLFHSPCCKLFNAEIVKVNHIIFPEDVNLGEDLRFNLSYIEKIKSICLVPKINYFYYK